MAKPTTIRIPDDLLDEIEQTVNERKLDRSAYLRDVLRKGILQDKRERIIEAYARGSLSLMEACRQLGSNPWDIFSILKDANLHLNVGLEGWLDAADLETNGV